MSICSTAAPDPRKRVILALTDEGRNGRRLAYVDSIEEVAEEWLSDESPSPPRKGLTEATAASLASRRRPARKARGEAPVSETAGSSRTANKSISKPRNVRAEPTHHQRDHFGGAGTR